MNIHHKKQHVKFIFLKKKMHSNFNANKKTGLFKFNFTFFSKLIRKIELKVKQTRRVK